jgi:hypothetical protein
LNRESPKRKRFLQRLIYHVPMKIPTLQTLVLLLVVCLACAEESQSSAIELTPTAVLPTPTATPWIVPTKTIADNLTADQLTLYGAVSLKKFPEELQNSSPVLDSETVIAIWRDFIEDSVVVAGVDTVIVLCGGDERHGRWYKSNEGPSAGYEGTEFTWHIAFVAGDRWNSPRLNFSVDPYTIANEFASNQGTDIKTELRAPDSNGEIRWHGLGGAVLPAFTKGELISVWHSSTCT